MPGASPLAASDGGAGLAFAFAGGAVRRRTGLEMDDREERFARFDALRRVLMKQ
jgi:hypothetical protein